MSVVCAACHAAVFEPDDTKADRIHLADAARRRRAHVHHFLADAVGVVNHADFVFVQPSNRGIGFECTDDLVAAIRSRNEQ